MKNINKEFEADRINKVISNRIRLVILLSGKTQSEVAQILEVRQATISGWVSGNHSITMFQYIQFYEKMKLYIYISSADWFQFDHNIELERRAQRRWLTEKMVY